MIVAMLSLDIDAAGYRCDDKPKDKAHVRTVQWLSSMCDDRSQILNQQQR